MQRLKMAKASSAYNQLGVGAAISLSGGSSSAIFNSAAYHGYQYVKRKQYQQAAAWQSSKTRRRRAHQRQAKAAGENINGSQRRSISISNEIISVSGSGMAA